MKKIFAVVILFSFFLLPFFNVYGVHMLTHDIQRLSPNALWGIGFFILLKYHMDNFSNHDCNQS